MVQYAEIKNIKTLIDKYNNKRYGISITDIDDTIYHLKKYKEILEGWYGDEQYHKIKEDE